MLAVVEPLSTLAEAWPLPLVAPAVKVAVAVPLDWIAACWPESAPS